MALHIMKICVQNGLLCKVDRFRLHNLISVYTFINKLFQNVKLPFNN